MPATIKDIAKRLNISVSTVSYALNGGPRQVHEDIRRRVLEVAKELDYRPNRLARSLVTRRSYCVGVIPAGRFINTMMSPYVQLCMNGIVNKAEELGYDVLLYTRYDQSQVDEMANTLLDGRTDGLICLSPPIGSKLMDLLAEKTIPYVATSTIHHPRAVCLNCDNEQGVRLAVSHLYNLGHRKIGHISGSPWLEDAQIREAAYRSEMERLGLEVRPEWVQCGEFHHDLGAEAFKRLMSASDPPTAVFCANDEMGVAAIRAAWLMGLRVPEDVSIVGFDDIPLSQYSQPKLTTVRQPIEEIGGAALEALVQLIERTGQPETTTYPTEIVVRESTDAPRSQRIGPFGPPAAF